MKVKYSTLWLALGGLEGTAGASWNGAQINDEVVFFRDAVATFFARGGRSTTFTFRSTKTFNNEAALLTWAGTHVSTLPEQADLILTDDEGTVAVMLADAVLDQPRISNVVGLSLIVEYTFRGGLFASEDVPEDSTVPSADTVKTGTIALSAADESKAVAYDAAFGASPKFVDAKIYCPTDGYVIDATPIEDSRTAYGFTAKFAAAIPGTGYVLGWTAIL